MLETDDNPALQEQPDDRSAAESGVGTRPWLVPLVLSMLALFLFWALNLGGGSFHDAQPELTQPQNTGPSTGLGSGIGGAAGHPGTMDRGGAGPAGSK